MINENRSEQDILNRWNSPINTLQAYVLKYPLLVDGANSGGTMTLVTGTSGTKLGTVYFNIATNWAYKIKTLSNNLIQSGTFGTVALNNVLIDDYLVGTNSSTNFTTVFGEDLTVASRIGFVLNVNCGTGVIGTFGIDCEVTGLKFKTV